ncbi:unnamed protein product [Thlaspi arvense]|uniref:GATA-type domain-containing protein n=1 Tax=Thlaspi arvense TaxID=13288 RepID=A0AAU9SFR2_THLAR|nr:unnamed protein product [Thlaspi arvense]
MAHKDVVVHEEEDLRAAMQKLPIPFKELEQSSIDSDYDGIRKIIEDPNLLFEDSRELQEHPTDNITRFSSNSSRVPSRAPKRQRNRQARRKRKGFESGARDFDDSEVNITCKSCLHCGTRNTPLWREGPKGAGTLCNACGMRYRKGQLLPEYRPASSPGFKPNVHSNFHRRVMEIRSKRNSPPPNSFGF